MRTFDFTGIAISWFVCSYVDSCLWWWQGLQCRLGCQVQRPLRLMHSRYEIPSKWKSKRKYFTMVPKPHFMFLIRTDAVYLGFRLPTVHRGRKLEPLKCCFPLMCFFSCVGNGAISRPDVSKMMPRRVHVNHLFPSPNSFSTKDLFFRIDYVNLLFRSPLY